MAIDGVPVTHANPDSKQAIVSYGASFACDELLNICLVRGGVHGVRGSNPLKMYKISVRFLLLMGLAPANWNALIGFQRLDKFVGYEVFHCVRYMVCCCCHISLWSDPAYQFC